MLMLGINTSTVAATHDAPGVIKLKCVLHDAHQWKGEESRKDLRC
jgi:hypothetical protein